MKTDLEVRECRNIVDQFKVKHCKGNENNKWLFSYVNKRRTRKKMELYLNGNDVKIKINSSMVPNLNKHFTLVFCHDSNAEFNGRKLDGQ